MGIAKIRQVAVTAAAALATMAIALPGASALPTSPHDRAAAMVKQHAPGASTRLTSSGLRVGEHTYVAARDRRTWVVQDQGSVALVAELEEGQSTARFDRVVPAGTTIDLEPDGSARLLDAAGVQTGFVDAPWAYDATGRALATHYVVHGTGLEQVVDTHAAVYPVVADPRITSGFHNGFVVTYVEMSWSETWKVKNAVDSDYSSAPALICTFLPNAAAKAYCGFMWLSFRADVKKTVNAAIAAKKCYKVRLPVMPSQVAWFATYDSYYLTCKS